MASHKIRSIKRELQDLIEEGHDAAVPARKSRKVGRSAATLSPDTSVSSDADLASILGADALLSGQTVYDFSTWWDGAMKGAPPPYPGSSTRLDTLSPLSDELVAASSPSSSEDSVDDALIHQIMLGSDDVAADGVAPVYDEVLDIPRVVDAVMSRYDGPVSALDDVRAPVDAVMNGDAFDANHESMSDDDSDGPGEGSKRGRGGPIKSLRDFLQSLTPEEREGMMQEKIDIPMDAHLSKPEERTLKKLRRKVRNKISAQESRKRKKDYVSGLEQRIEMYNTANGDLKSRVQKLEDDNRTLVRHLRKLQSLLAPSGGGRNALLGTTTSTGVCLMVVLLSFSIFTTPMHGIQTPIGGSASSASAGRVVAGSGASMPRPVSPSNSYRSRTLMQLDDGSGSSDIADGSPSLLYVTTPQVSVKATAPAVRTNSSEAEGVASTGVAALDAVTVDQSPAVSLPPVVSSPSLKQSIATVGRVVAEKAAQFVAGRGADVRVTAAYNGGSVVALPE